MNATAQNQAATPQKAWRELWVSRLIQPGRARWLAVLTGLVIAAVIAVAVCYIATEKRDLMVSAGDESKDFSIHLTDSTLIWMLAALATFNACALLITWRQMRRGLQKQKTLAAEASFRRAMESSILTGMRALDMNGRITYVNTAFCQMTGWSEQELVGQSMPFTFWPQSMHEELVRRLRAEFNGKTTPGGIRTRIQRKDGSLFDVRIHISPLRDASGLQTGWMTSMTDITEPTRIRTQLLASHERFSFVLDSLEASVSVALPGSDELLFANTLYRKWFGDDGAHGDLWRAAQASRSKVNPVRSDKEAPGSDTTVTEIFVAQLGKWLEIRSRQLDWADGRIVLMVIATDVTQRHHAEEQAALHAERMQTASRLITMGEMASSVAHELNQPLSAITNYCSGVITRIKNQKITEQGLLSTLEKTSHQAQRAGQIIQRIHSFVKRSEPNRTLTCVATIVSEAVELAQLELHRRNVQLSVQVSPELPTLMVDPILIEQVLINLLKNAADSIDQAARPIGQRHVTLHVDACLQDNIPGIKFSVRDTGTGLAPDVLARLFDAFYSTKPEGMGIGLKLCRSIVESHQGRLHAENLHSDLHTNDHHIEEGIIGCLFTVWIPLTKPIDGLTNNKREAHEPDTSEHNCLPGGR